ncbi:MAG: gamma carbonic anhydrase family protein [Alkaliphilus sp.]|nr:MAG: gamma carbonic anhydrase family protein [Alkaliphilus sp.]
MIKSWREVTPEIDNSCFIAETADIIGDVKIGKNSNIWYGAVIRGDDKNIIIGENTNIQDNAVVHISNILPTIIGDNITVGHSAIIHACKIGDNTLIGMGSIILNGAEIGKNTIIGAGTMVPPGKKIPEGVLAFGSPVKIIRDLSDDEIMSITKSAKDYVGFANEHRQL